MIESVSLRLRSLRDQSGWTVADMAERTGIPKRTLDKYMLRSGASLPGLDALCALSRGLGVSLDWLVFGSEGASEGVELIAERAGYHVGKLFAEKVLCEYLAKNPGLFIGERILNLTPEAWAIALGGQAGEEARRLVSDGVTKADLLEWKRRMSERSGELFDDMVRELLPESSLAKKLESRN